MTGVNGVAPHGSMDTLSVSDTLRDRTIFIIGSTGFVGKVYLFLLLRRHVDVEKVYCLIRRKPGMTPAERLRKDVLESPAFDPLREAMGSEVFDWITREKLEAIEGDVGLPDLGIAPEQFQALASKVDVIVNSSGLVDFNPPLEEALYVNAIGIQHVVDVAEAWKAPVLHVSTCYVAGKQSGTIFEDSDLVGWFPKRGEMDGVVFDPRCELEEGLRLARLVREESTHQDQRAQFIHEARRRLREEARNPEDEVALEKAIDRVREKWINSQLIDYGIRRAATYGWTNIYTYSKSLGEQVVAQARVPWAIVRPSIIESSIRYPFPGWNEGFNTTAPLAFLAIKGQLNYPSGRDLALDLIPVDQVAAGMLAVTAALIERCNAKVYHLASGDLNPCRMTRIVELVGLFKRRYYLDRPRGNPLLNQIYARFEARPVSQETYQRFSAPMVSRLAGAAAGLASALAGGQRRGVMGLVGQVAQEAKAFEKRADNVERLMEIFLPFTVHNSYRFRCENIRALYARLSPEDRASMPWDPDTIDWMHYWLEVHLKGLEKWVFPRIKDKLEKKPLPEVYTYEDLLELFDAATSNHADELSMRMLTKEGEERYTYAEVRERAAWVATFLVDHGVRSGDRVLLISENRPQWAMAYFGSLQAGAVCVPVDSKATAREIANLVKASGARAILFSDKVWPTLSDALTPLLPETVSTFTFSQVLQKPAQQLIPLVPRQDGSRMASIIYTSGTTGVPKGVMLSHKNFAHLLSSMAKIFRLGPRDRVLSVLPLHHTFEFTTGFLLPFSRGTAITHIEELTGEMVQEAFKRYKVTAMLGVPALWEVLYRKVRSRAQERGAVTEGLFLGLHWLHRTLRDKTGINIGRYLFAEIHDGFGGRVKYLISGGAALPQEVQKGFAGFGMDLFEGYGLTEASPVLTVNRPGKRPTPGSVGVPLPGIEVRIHNPDEAGVGEIIARGPNVMSGYFNDPESTAQVIQDGWLYTGDLGRIDSTGRVFIVGRKKEVIVDASGKNVYPDEIEELYAGCAYVKELSVVGLSDGRGSEQVACLIVPETGGPAEGMAESEVRLRIEDHFRSVGLTLPYHQRVKVLRFRDQPLPRTATRKVRRRDVVRLLEGILKSEEATAATGKQVGQVSDAWLIEVVARVTGRKRDEITSTTRFADDLGVDSLMAAELLAALEDKSGGALEIQDLVDAHNIEGLARRLRDRNSSHVVAPVPARPPARISRELWKVDLSRLHEVQVPETVRTNAKRVLRRVQRLMYEEMLDVKVTGRAFIPQNRNVLVISNHASHLDMGLAKAALGEYGEDLISLAAADYFFADGPKRFYFENFTNAVPLDRLNPSRESIRRAQTLLEEGHNLLLFPEGTRSPSGEIQPFKRGVGMMALRFGVDVLPMYLGGTYEAMPRGAMMPRKRRVEVRIGAPITYTDLSRVTQGMPPLQAQTLAARILQRAVEALRDRKTFDLEDAMRDGPVKAPLEQLFDELQVRFEPGRVEQPVTFYFSLGPEDAHKWTVMVNRAVCEIVRGKRDGKADCVLKTSIPMFTRIVKEGYVPAVSEFMNGAVKTNDPGRLQQFQTIFNLS